MANDDHKQKDTGRDQKVPMRDNQIGRVIREDRRNYDTTIQPQTVGEGGGKDPQKPKSG